jgi:predicted permease
MLPDLRHAFRRLLKSPGFTTVAIVTLALGIGLNTSMFSLMNLLVLRPLPYPDKDHLVRIYRTTPQTQTANHVPPDFLDVVRSTHDFADVAGYEDWGYTLAQDGRPPVNLNALRVSANFFSIIGLKPELGRFFTPDEDRPGNHVIVLSYATWQAQFGGDPAIVGRTVRIDSEPTTIVGVLPQAFASVMLWGPGDAFRPLALTDEEKVSRNNAAISLVARYHSDLTLEQLNQRLAAVAAELATHRPREQSQDGLHAVTLQSTATNPSTRGITAMLLGLAGFVLLIACGNLANLQLARVVARTQEFAVRAALGASRSRLLRPLLLESLLLSLAGGLLGLLVASWANDWISSELSANGVVTFTLTLDWVVFVFAIGLSVVTGVVFGLVPAWAMSRVRVNDTLKSGGRGQTSNRTHNRLRHVLIVGQFALALMLLAGAGVFIRGFQRMLTRDAGWDHSSVLQAILSLPQARYKTPAESYAFYTRLQERLAALPGVENATVGWTIPVFSFLTTRSYVVEGRDLPPAGHEPQAFVNGVMPSYLPTLKIPLLSGRNFTDADQLHSRPVAIINESMARALFPNENPIGHRIGGTDANNRGWMEIVGVIPDVRFALSVTTPATHFLVFRPLAQEPWNYVGLAVRARSPETFAGPVRQVIADLDPNLPVQQLDTVNHFVERGGGLGMVNIVLAAFALLGLFLAALGLYGVIARLVAQRTPEVGLRIALGAQPRDVVWLILRSGLKLTLIGTAIGLIGAAGLVRFIGSLLAEYPVQDPLAVAAVTLLLVAVALLACWLPARRATRVDPVTALRAE